MNRHECEAQPNWRATFRRTSKWAREPFDCLMESQRLPSGGCGFYWYTPDYAGMYPAGATRTFEPWLLADSLDRGLLELVAGELPPAQEEPR